MGLAPARSLVVAPRLPQFPRNHTGDPFTSDGDIVVDCDQLDQRTGKKCEWHVIGVRREVKAAVKAHNQMFHSEQIGVILLNQPRQ